MNLDDQWQTALSAQHDSPASAEPSDPGALEAVAADVETPDLAPDALDALPEAEGLENTENAEDAEGSPEAPTAEPEPPPDPERERIAKRFARAAERERRLQEERLRYKQEREAFETERQRFTQERVDWQKLAQESPEQFLAKAGIDYSELTRRILHGNAAPDPKLTALEEQVQALQRELQATEGRQHLKNYLTQIERAIADGGARYAFTRVEATPEQVFDFMSRAHQQGRTLTVDETLDLLEDHYEKQDAEKQQARDLKRGLSAAKPVAHAREATPPTLSRTHQQTAPRTEPELPLDPDERWAAIKSGYQIQ
jgi:phage terminase large subunit-like protein